MNTTQYAIARRNSRQHLFHTPNCTVTGIRHMLDRSCQFQRTSLECEWDGAEVARRGRARSRCRFASRELGAKRGGGRRDCLPQRLFCLDVSPKLIERRSRTALHVSPAPPARTPQLVLSYLDADEHQRLQMGCGWNDVAAQCAPPCTKSQTETEEGTEGGKEYSWLGLRVATCGSLEECEQVVERARATGVGWERSRSASALVLPIDCARTDSSLA